MTDADIAERIGRYVDTFRTGCSNTVGGVATDCAECTARFLNAVTKTLAERGHSEQVLPQA